MTFSTFALRICCSHSSQQTIDHWKFHASKVNTLAWTPDSKHLASGSLDTNVIIWSIASPMKRVLIKSAHPTADLTRLEWLSDTSLLTAGRDGSFRTWEVTHHP